MGNHVTLYYNAGLEEDHFDDLLALSARDVLNYFKCIPPEDYHHYGIHEEDIPFGTFPAFKHPSMFPSHLGGNAYGIGLFEQRLLSDEELKFLETVDFSNPLILKKYFATINEIYRKMGLLIRVSRKGIFYYLIPSSFLSHLILDVQSRANLIVSIFPEIKEGKILKIGIMSSPDDILIHELAGRFPSHRFVAISEPNEIQSRASPFDAIICPHSFEDYLRIGLTKSSPRFLISRRNTLFKVSGYVLSLIRKNLSLAGSLIIISPSVLSEASLTQKVIFLSKTYLKLFQAFAALYKSSLPKGGAIRINEEISVSNKDIQTFLRLAPSIKAEVQKIFNRPFDQVEEKEIESLSLRCKIKPATLDTQKTTKKLLPIFFELVRSEEVFPEEYRALWEKHINIKEFPPLFSCVRANPRKPEVSRKDIELFLEKSSIAGCPVSLVADYKNTINYVMQVLDFLEEDLSKKTREPDDSILDGIYRSLKKDSRVRKLIENLLSCRKKLESIQAILGPSGIVNEPVRFFECIPELSLFGLSLSQLQEMGLIVTGHSSLGRVAMGKYPVSTLLPLVNLSNQHPEKIYYLILMTIAELRASLGRKLTKQEELRISEVIENVHRFSEPVDQLDDRSFNDLLGIAYNRIMVMSRTEVETEENKFYSKIPIDQIIEKFCVDREFLIAFLRAKFHGTGHILPFLGFFPSLILLWSCLSFWKYVYGQYEGIRLETPEPVINLNHILKGVPQEHRPKQIEKLREALIYSVRSPSKFSLCETISFSLSEGKSWFWPEAKLQFSLNPNLNTIDVEYLDLGESIRVLESFSKCLESKSVRSIPTVLIQEVDQHISKMLRYVGGTENILALERYNKILHSTFVYLLKSLFEKLLSSEDAYEMLMLVSKQSPSLFSIIFPNIKEENIYNLKRAFRKLRSITEKRISGFHDARQGEFTYPPLEDRIGISIRQFQELEKMLSSVHEDFIMYKAMIISLIVNHFLPSADRILSVMLESGDISSSHVETIRRHIKNLLRARDIILSVTYARNPLISLGDVISLNSKRTFVDASFLLVTILEDIPKGFIEAETLSYLLSIRGHLLEVIEKGKSWREHLVDVAIQKGLSLRSVDLDKVEFPIAKDLELYGNFIGKVDIHDTEYGSALVEGRYVLAFDRVLRFYGLTSVQFRDIITFLEGVPLITLYRNKDFTSIVFNTFKKLMEKAKGVCDTIFSYPLEQRLTLISHFDELSPSPLHPDALNIVTSDFDLLIE